MTEKEKKSQVSNKLLTEPRNELEIIIRKLSDIEKQEKEKLLCNIQIHGKTQIYSNSGDSFLGIKVILNDFFNDNSTFYCFSFVDEFNENIKKIDLEHEAQSYIFSASKEEENKKIEKGKSDLIFSKLLEFKKCNKNNGMKSSDGKLLPFARNMDMIKEWQDLAKTIIKEKKYPEILIFEDNIFNNSIYKIEIDSHTYKLCSASINIPDTRVITGIICDGQNYVYDSNNKIVETDWPNNDIKKYLNEIGILSSHFSFGYLIYIKYTTT